MKILKKIINAYKNYHPSKWEAIAFLSVPLLISILSALCIGGDVWFLLNVGKYICNHGFFHIDPFTIHQGLEVIAQQWAVDVIYFKVYDLFGLQGLYILVNILNTLILINIYKLLMVVTDKKRNLSVIFTIIISSMYFFSFTDVRPQLFSVNILLLELIFLEKYFKTNNWKYLISLPILSVLMINCHASMWWLLFCFYVPFLLNTFKYKVDKIESKKREKKYLIIFGLLMLLAGFINPYGIKAMTYVLNSYGIEAIDKTISEMKAIDIHNTLGKLVFLIIAVVYYSYLRLKKIEARHFFLLLGTTYLALSSNRGHAFLLIGGIYPLAYYLKNKFSYVKEQKNKYYLLTIGIFVTLVIIPLILFMCMIPIETDNPVKEGIDYIAETENIKDVKLYCRYGSCNYAEWVGIKPYIDSRAEVFLKSNNKKDDIFEEFYYLQNKVLYYKNFVNKYDFTHLIVEEGDYLYTTLSNDPEYTVIYEGVGEVNYNLLQKERIKYKVFEKKIVKPQTNNKKIDKKN